LSFLFLPPPPLSFSLQGCSGGSESLLLQLCSREVFFLHSFSFLPPCWFSCFRSGALVTVRVVVIPSWFVLFAVAHSFCF